MRLIDGDALYAKLQEHEELARKRVLDTESTLPFPTNLNPAYTRYLAQLDERTALKHMVADVPTIEQPEIIHCKDCYYRYGRYCHYRYTNGLFISADHYCGFAKRQEDDK